MTNIDLVKQHTALKAVIAKAKELKQPELQGHWGKYVCVLTAGFLENTIRILYGAHAQREASPAVAAFVSRQLGRIQNPKSGKFLDVASGFDGAWAVGLMQYLDEDAGKRRNAIDSIMNNRNLIAHGRNCNISVAQVKQYFDTIEQIVDYIEDQCK